jgi:hypothetical protein
MTKVTGSEKSRKNVWGGHSCPLPLILVFDFGGGFCHSTVKIKKRRTGECPPYSQNSCDCGNLSRLTGEL